ncbi:hypothetical protein [Helicobacter bizzozeronii]|uniref:hypothetical protein n=1 Tax=Helicobacter bizzozeronii TaxID=56877 RepID=UPI0013154837|nr:hypothetical protein [Helicobacter bizzozeronii]
MRSRGYESELQGIEAITATQDTEVLSALCEVFGIEADLQMIQEVLEDQKNMEEKEASKAEFKTQHALVPLAEPTKALVAHTTTLNAHSTPHAPSFKDYLKSYTALKNKLYNAQDLESGKAVLRELIQDYAELLEMDKHSIQRGLYWECEERQIRQKDRDKNKDYLLPAFLWLHLVLHTGWQYVWHDIYDDGNNYHNESERMYHIELKFRDMAHFVKPKVLVIDNDCQTLTFDKMVCINFDSETPSRYWYLETTENITTLEVDKDSCSYERGYGYGSFDKRPPKYHYLSGAIKINNTYGNVLLSYLEIDI